MDDLIKEFKSKVVWRKTSSVYKNREETNQNVLEANEDENDNLDSSEEKILKPKNKDENTETPVSSVVKNDPSDIYLDVDIDIEFNDKITIENIGVYIDFVTHLKLPKLIIENRKAILILKKLASLLSKEESFKSDNMEFLIEQNFLDLIKYFYDFFYENFTNYIRRGKFDINLENNHPSFTKIFLIIEITELLALKSSKFSKCFNLNQGIKSILKFFDDKKLVNFLLKCGTDEDSYKDERRLDYRQLLSRLLDILFIFKCKKIVDNQQTSILIRFTESIRLRNLEFIFKSYLIFCSSLMQREIARLKYFNRVCDLVSDSIACLADFDRARLKMFEYHFIDEKVERSFEINVKNWKILFMDGLKFTIRSLLVSDKVAYEMFEKIKYNLMKLIRHNEENEIQFALYVIIEFAFNPITLEKIRELENIYEILNQILNNDEISDSCYSLAHLLKNLLTIEKLYAIYEANQIRKTIIEPETFNNILLSYSEVDELKSMKIKIEMEKNGLKVNLLQKRVLNDLTHKDRINLDNLTNSIEMNDFLIVCMNDSYESDQFCHFESYYAQRLNKKIIPVFLETRYAPDKWLRELCNQCKPFFIKDFESSNFNYEINKLTKRIQNEAASKATSTLSISKFSSFDMSKYSKF